MTTTDPKLMEVKYAPVAIDDNDDGQRQDVLTSETSSGDFKNGKTEIQFTVASADDNMSQTEVPSRKFLYIAACAG